MLDFVKVIFCDLIELHSKSANLGSELIVRVFIRS